MVWTFGCMDDECDVHIETDEENKPDKNRS